MILCKIFCLITKPRQFTLVVQTVRLEFGNDLNINIYQPILSFYINNNYTYILSQYQYSIDDFCNFVKL